jgi:hypothetical protein
MIGLWIKSMKISILKQKKNNGFKIKFCEDKKLRFCDVESRVTTFCHCHIVSPPMHERD